jgi:DNA-binding protein HU-beta
MAKKTIVGEVAGSVSDAVATAIDAVTHPVKTATQARRAFGRPVTKTKRGVTVKKKAAKKKAAKKAARKVVSKTKRTTKRAVSKTKRVVRKAAKKATKRLKRR